MSTRVNIGLVLLASCTPAALGVVTTFENGREGWNISGRTNVALVGGNPGACLDNVILDVFGIDIRNNTNPAFLGNYQSLGAPITISVDVRTDSITFGGQQVPRDLVLELRDTTNPPPNYPWVSVWITLGTLSQSQPGWRTFSTTIANPSSATLPAGWGGTGAEDQFGNPLLPANRTFASVLASVDEIAFTTFKPGFFFGFTNFDLAVDNPTLIPAPSAAALGLLGAGLLIRRQRPR